MKFSGHAVSREEMENLVVTGFVEGKRAQRRKSETYLTYLQNRKDLTPIELIHLVNKRDVWFLNSLTLFYKHVHFHTLLLSDKVIFVMKHYQIEVSKFMNEAWYSRQTKLQSALVDTYLYHPCLI